MRKKTISLFLISALLCTSLLAGCSKAPIQLPTPGGVTETDDTTSNSDASTEKEDATISANDSDLLQVNVREHNTIITNPETYQIEVETGYINLQLSSEDRAAHPELAATFEEYNKEAEGSSLLDQMDLVQMYNEMFADNQFGSDMQLTSVVTGNICRADDKVVSVLWELEWYGGGAHPDNQIGGDNFDVQTGAVLELEDVISDWDGFFALVDQKMQTEYADAYSEMADVQEYAQSVLHADPNDEYAPRIPFSMDPTGITVFFNNYILGPYVMGRQVIHVDYQEAPELFNNQWISDADSFAMRMSLFTPYTIDVNGDGTAETFSIEETFADEYGNYNEFSLVRDNTRLPITSYAYSANAYLVCQDGSYFIYLIEYGDNDWAYLHIVDPVTMAEVGDGLSGYSFPSPYVESYSDEETHSYESTRIIPTFLSPDSFELTRRVCVLGTGSVYRQYHTGADGVPVPDEDYYHSSSTYVITSIRDVPCDIVDVDGNVIQADAIIPEGLSFYLLRSDVDSWMDIQVVDPDNVEQAEYGDYQFLKEDQELNPDKEIYRIYLENGEGVTDAINGSPASDYFSGIVYAG